VGVVEENEDNGKGDLVYANQVLWS